MSDFTSHILTEQKIEVTWATTGWRLLGGGLVVTAVGLSLLLLWDNLELQRETSMSTMARVVCVKVVCVACVLLSYVCCVSCR